MMVGCPAASALAYSRPVQEDLGLRALTCHCLMSRKPPTWPWPLLPLHWPMQLQLLPPLHHALAQCCMPLGLILN